MAITHHPGRRRELDRNPAELFMDDISESPQPVRARNGSFYAVLFAVVVPLWSLVPASWLFVLYSLYTGRVWLYGIPGNTTFFLALCEVSSRCPYTR